MQVGDPDALGEAGRHGAHHSAEQEQRHDGARGAPMRGAPMRGAPMRGAPMRGAPMCGAPMRGAPMRGAPMRGAPVGHRAIVAPPALRGTGVIPAPLVRTSS